ncbi:DUF4132 domain-containing protein [Thermobifida halotolerans]|uniref:DUF4132 domain-containing protein n=1 Tax=Thermobifida halotolerans TaxID=483545 RepID=A0AA97M2B0_9ACTN|nr:DUF4132 domain-containing protein [Thermobifida halotolerans]UOE18059.1 DUF4132 domain-containing protein [Thermobifida halotolerans]
MDRNRPLPSETADPGEWAERMRADGFVKEQSIPFLVEIHTPELPGLVDEYEAAVLDAFGPRYSTYQFPDIRGTRLDGFLRDLDADRARPLALWVLLCQMANAYDVPRQMTLTRLTRRRIDWTARDLSLMLRCLLQHSFSRAVAPYRLALTACERADDAVLRECAEQIRALHRSYGGADLPGYADQRQIGARLDRIVERLGGAPVSARERFGGDVGPLLAAEIPDTLDSPDLADLLTLCAAMRTIRPNRRWRGEVAALLAERTHLPGEVRTVLEQVPRLADVLHERFHDHSFASETAVLLLRGLLWSAAEMPPEQAEWVAPLLGDIACHVGTGPGGSKVVRVERLATTAIEALAARGDAAAAAALARVLTTVRKKTVLNTARRALDGAAARTGLTPDELMDRTVPDHGLGPDGAREEALGEHTAVLGIGADGSPALTFRTPTGRRVKSPPKAVRERHGARLKELRAELGELKTLLPVQQRRLETALGEGRIWDLASWPRHVMDHPVTGHHARRLLWEVSTDGGRTWRGGLPDRDGARWLLRDAVGAEVFDSAGAETALLRLWHPIRATPEAVRAWRDHLVAAELVQPFKQAFREVYLLTPAEEATRVHSNRYAAHILKYGQTKALLGSRGWQGPQLGYWDGGESGEAHRVYRDAATGQEWRAAFFLDLVEHEEDNHALASCCSSDQVRFTRVGEDAPAPLKQVPPLVFSEAMRDVDLAVGVASVAADPEWGNRGRRRHNAYWRRTAFGDLTESAEMRRAALRRLVPRLRIADRLEVTDRFLRVRGDLRTYRIHLGSANILMEPDDSYLCIVDARGADTLYLPFEGGGGRLSLILSKAFLLAADTEITDPTITRQIRRK